MIDSNQLLIDVGLGKKDTIDSIIKQHLRKMTLFVIRNKGSKDEVNDLMQEALYHLFRNAQKTPRPVIADFHAYFATIYRNLWMKQLKLKSRREIGIQGFTSNDSDDDDVDHDYYYAYLVAFKQLNNDCQNILRYFITKKKISEIAQIMNISNDYAKRKKYLCKEKLKKIAQQEFKKSE